MLHYYQIGKCFLGYVLAVNDYKGLRKVSLADDKESFTKELQDESVYSCVGGINYIDAIVEFIENPSTKLDLPLSLSGTDFQNKVWNVLTNIPIGESLSYKEVAKLIEQPKAARAVALACAANQLAVVIPYHRVIRSNGDISGYRWGIERKRALLNRESLTKKFYDKPRAV